MKELPGVLHDNPQVLAMLKLDGDWPQHDEVSWCSAFINYVAWLLRLPRSKSLLARSWLGVGSAVNADQLEVGFDVVILSRGAGKQPGPEDMTAPGHVGFYAGLELDHVMLLGGNQGNGVNVSAFSLDRVLGMRRLS